MQTSDFDYNLPDELITDQPPVVRGTSRLLALNRLTGRHQDRHYGDVIDYLEAGDVLVLNDTKVIPARLNVTKQGSGVERELILLEKHGSSDDWFRHKVMYRRRLSAGDELVAKDGTTLRVEEVIGDGIAVVSCSEDLLELANRVGNVPLPPYMHREATASDIERYQTVWANEAGSVAAPTASLNMTADMLQKLEAKGVIIKYATLHVGLGTFLPIRTDNLAEHVMHKEYFEVPADTVKAIRKAKASNHVVMALGTTITRTLEYAAPQILDGPLQDLHGEADIFMYPGYEFKLIDMLLTNFHAPSSTVLMLTAAFAGWEHLLAAYNHAVAARYQFLSYGDSMLIHTRSKS